MKSMYLILFRLMLLASITHQAFAQNLKSDSLRHSYIEPLARKINFGPTVRHRYPIFIISGPDALHKKLYYRPNNSATAGIRGNIFGISLETTLSLSKGSRSISRFGESHSSDFVFNGVGNTWYGDLQWLNYQGLYLRKSWENYGSDAIFPSNRAMRIRTRSASFTWIFKPEKFSLRSAYLFTERQIRSSGSPLMRIHLSVNKFNSNDPLLSETDQDYFPDLNQVHGIHFTSFGIGAGYSYTFVPRKNFFINGTFVAGPAHYWSKYLNTGIQRTYDVQFNLNTYVGFSAGYNGDRFYGGFTFRGQKFSLKMNSSEISGNQNSFALILGIRFRESGILQKRLNDLNYTKVVPWIKH